MCVKVIINLGEKEIETPLQFEYHFGFSCDPEKSITKFQEDLCLCGWDIETALQMNSVPFKEVDGDFYVGRLEDLLAED